MDATVKISESGSQQSKLSISKSARREMMAIARRAIEEKRFSVAELISNTLREVAPDWPQWLEIRGLIQKELGLKEDYIRIFKQCLSRYPKSSLSLAIIMDEAANAHEWSEIVDLGYNRALDDSCVSSLLLACDRLAGRGDSTKSLEGLNILIDRKLANVDVYIRASRQAVAARDFNLNRSFLDSLRVERPSNPYGYLADYHELMGAGQVDKARAELHRLDQEFPNNGILLTNLAEIALELYDVKEASILIQRLEGSLSGRRLRELQIRLAACSRDWESVLSLSNSDTGAQSEVRSQILQIYAFVHLGRTDTALDLCSKYEAEAKARGLGGRWFAVARQVANFRRKTGTFSTAPDYRIATDDVAADMMVPAVIQMLWVGGDLSPVEQLSIKSWLSNGFRVALYTYGNVANVPAGCELRDAVDIMPGDSVFVHSSKAGKSRGSYAGFADIFRWNLLKKVGGFWADCDIICLKPFELPNRLVIASEMARTFNADHMAVTNCFFGGPSNHSLFVEACERIQNYDPEAMNWGEFGTQLIGELVDANNLEGSVLPSSCFNKILPYRIISAMFGQNDLWLEDEMNDAWGVHLYNEIWRSHHVSKWGPFPRDSVIHRLFARYDIKVDITPAIPTRPLNKSLDAAS